MFVLIVGIFVLFGCVVWLDMSDRAYFLLRLCYEMRKEARKDLFS